MFLIRLPSVVEVWATRRLLASPAFHRMVGRIHQKIHNLKHGVFPEERGGTTLENNKPGFRYFLRFFQEEIKGQLKGKPPSR
jgi:hypothetical protein